MSGRINKGEKSKMKNKTCCKGGWSIAWAAVGCCILLLWGTVSPPKAEECKMLKRFKVSEVRFNTPINLIFYSDSDQVARQAQQAALVTVEKLENIFTDYHSESELRRLCAKSDAKTSIKISRPLFRVLVRAEQVAKESGGAFDVTVGPVVKLWRRAIRKQELPAPDRLAEAKSRVGYQMIHLNAEDQSVLLDKTDMRIDLGGIAKGYIIDQVLEVFRQHGIRRALVDIGGDIGLGDPPPGKKGWTIAIAPLEGLAADGTRGPFCFVELSNCAIATSGDTERFVEIDGRRYSHLIDPRTGIGITDHSNVTVIAPDAMTADALASAVSVLGPAKGLKLIDQTPNTETLILRRPDRELEVYRSSGFPESKLLK